MELILASGSPYRKWLLDEAGLDCRVVVSHIEEPDLNGASDLEESLVELAQRKGRAVLRAGHEGLILSADTCGHVAGQVMGKPASQDDAERMLRAISGTTHEVLTGWSLLRTHDGLCVSGVDRTRISMRDWTEAELADYLQSGEWQNKCGAYGLRLGNDPFITHLEGSQSNVIGLPLERLRPLLAWLRSI